MKGTGVHHVELSNKSCDPSFEQLQICSRHLLIKNAHFEHISRGNRESSTSLFNCTWETVKYKVHVWEYSETLLLVYELGFEILAIQSSNIHTHTIYLFTGVMQLALKFFFSTFVHFFFCNFSCSSSLLMVCLVSVLEKT